MFRNINWNFVGLQSLLTIICVNIVAIIWLNQTSEKILLSGCQIFLAIMVLLLLRTKIRGSFGSLEIYLGGCLGVLLVSQKFNFLTIGVALVAIWLLEANEPKPESLSKRDLLLTTTCLLACCGLAFTFFGLNAEQWIISVLAGWFFQISYLLGKPFEWNSTPSGGIWFPVEKHNPNLWIVFFFIANLGLLGLTVVIGNFNLALILVLGKIVQKDRAGRWISITRLIAVFLVILPEVLQNLLQFLLQYY